MLGQEQVAKFDHLGYDVFWQRAFPKVSFHLHGHEDGARLHQFPERLIYSPCRLSAAEMGFRDEKERSRSLISLDMVCGVNLGGLAWKKLFRWRRSAVVLAHPCSAPPVDSPNRHVQPDHMIKTISRGTHRY